MALKPADVPADAPNDAVMASPAEVKALAAWASAAFAGARPEPSAPGVKLELRRQDHNVLRFGRSILQTPLRIGRRTFQRGIGTHAHSEIAVTVPAGAKAFHASVGVDNNDDTAGRHGSVQFIVEVGGKEALRTPTLRGGGEPVAVNVDLQADATYTVELFDEARGKTVKTMAGRDMAADFPLLIPQRRGSLLARYRPADAARE